MFATLTVLENLEMGARTPAARAARRGSLDEVFALFPRLKERARADRRDALGGRAADAGHRPRPDGAAAPAPPGRAVAGLGADRRPEHHGNRRDGQSSGDYNSARGAERASGPRAVRPRLRRRERRRRRSRAHAKRFFARITSGRHTSGCDREPERIRRAPGLAGQRDGGPAGPDRAGRRGSRGRQSADVLERVARAAATLVSGSLVHVWLASGDQRELRLATEIGSRPDHAGAELRRTVPLGEGLLGAVVRSAEPVVVPSFADDERVFNRVWARDQGMLLLRRRPARPRRPRCSARCAS